MTQQFSRYIPEAILRNLDWWEDLQRRLTQEYGPGDGGRRYVALVDGTAPDLIRWRNLGQGG